MPTGFPTPEEAALAGFDSRYARVVETRYWDDDHAEVYLATNEDPTLYPYFVQAVRVEGMWHEGGSANVPFRPDGVDSEVSDLFPEI